MTTSLYNIAKACIWQSKYKTNNTNNELKKISYISNKESRIFIQEEINFLTNLFTWYSFEFIISFMFSGDYFLSKSGIIRLIWLMNACLCTGYLLHCSSSSSRTTSTELAYFSGSFSIVKNFSIWLLRSLKLTFFRRLIDDPQTILFQNVSKRMSYGGRGGGEEGFLARFTEQ